MFQSKTLYWVDINLIIQYHSNTQQVILNYPNVNIVNDLGGQVLYPMDTIKEKFPRPANKHIHVIVEVPAAGKWTIIFLSVNLLRRK
jgi:hypothetical protein